MCAAEMVLSSAYSWRPKCPNSRPRICLVAGPLNVSCAPSTAARSSISFRPNRDANRCRRYTTPFTSPPFTNWATRRVTCARLSPVIRRTYRRTRPFTSRPSRTYPCCRRTRVIQPYTSSRSFPLKRTSLLLSTNARICSRLSFSPSSMLMINAQHAQISAFRNRASGSSCVRNELQLQAHLALDKTGVAQATHRRVQWNGQPHKHAPVAQLDRASGYEPEGRVFESPRAHHKIKHLFVTEPSKLELW